MKRVLVLGKGLVGSSLSGRFNMNAEFQTFSLSRSEFNFRDSVKLKEQISYLKPSVVIIAAGVVGGIERNLVEPYDLGIQNSVILNNIVSVCLELKIENLINLVPACVYPANISRRMNPNDLWTGPMEKTSLAYSTAKLLGVVLVAAARAQFGKRWVSVIATNIYGSAIDCAPQKQHVIPALLRKFHEAKISGVPQISLLGDGTPVREFMHVDDLASAVAFVVENQVYMDSVVNVSGTDSCTIKELADLIKKITCFDGEVSFDNTNKNGAASKLLDGSRLHQLGWAPKISLEHGIDGIYANIDIP
jgi:GDP-L-fucose synthase